MLALALHLLLVNVHAAVSTCPGMQNAAQCNATETDDSSAVQDVFSAGCVLAEMFLDGKLLFDRPQVPPHILLHCCMLFTLSCASTVQYSLDNQTIRDTINTCQLQSLQAVFKHIGAIAHVEHNKQLLH